MRILGYSRYSFTPDDGKPISGVTFYCGYPISKSGTGFRTAKPFSLTDVKFMAACPSFSPDELVGCDVQLLFDNWGKVVQINLM